MGNYSYVVTDSNGNSVKGTVTADNRADAISELKSKGNMVISIEESILGGKSSDGGSKSGKKPKTGELAVFCRQFVSIVEAGVPVISCLDMLQEQTENPALRYALSDCKSQIEQGETFSAAMAMHPRVFPKMLVTLTAAGEAAGSLEVSFIRMAEQFEKEAHIQATVKKAGVYPAVLFVVMVGVVIVMLTFVVPQFEAMFADMGTGLPAITVFVVNLSGYMQENWHVVVAGLVVGTFGLMKFVKSPMGESVISVLTLKLPVVSNLVTKTACARMSRTLSTLLGSGLSIIEAIDITADTMTNLLFKSAIENVSSEVSLGTSMNQPLREAGIFPPLVYHMVSIGEETGNTEKMLDTLAEYYEKEVEAATEALMALLEPVTIVVLAIVVGGIIGSVMAPMATMYEELGNL